MVRRHQRQQQAVQPATPVAQNGTLTYAAAPNAYGGATVTVVLHDDGGVENGGADTSEPQTFIIIVNSVIDALIDVKPGNGDEIDPIKLVPTECSRSRSIPAESTISTPDP